MQISFLKKNFISIISSVIVTHFIYTKICLASQDFVRMNKSQRQVIYKWDWNTILIIIESYHIKPYFSSTYLDWGVRWSWRCTMCCRQSDLQKIELGPMWKKIASRNPLTLRMIDRIFCISWAFWHSLSRRNLVSMLYNFYNFIFLRTTHNLYSLTIATFLYLAIQLASCSPHHSVKQRIWIPGWRRIKSPITVRFPDPKQYY